MRRALALVLFQLEIGLVAVPALGQAQDFYGGIAYDYALDGEGQGGLAAYAGVRFGEGALSFGAELTHGFGDGDPFEATRVRGLVRQALGGFGLFGSLGLSQFDLFGGGVVDGINLGVGADYGLTDATSLRFEMIVDRVPDYGPDVTSLRMSVAFGF